MLNTLLQRRQNLSPSSPGLQPPSWNRGGFSMSVPALGYLCPADCRCSFPTASMLAPHYCVFAQVSIVQNDCNSSVLYKYGGRVGACKDFHILPLAEANRNSLREEKYCSCNVEAYIFVCCCIAGLEIKSTQWIGVSWSLLGKKYATLATKAKRLRWASTF